MKKVYWLILSLFLSLYVNAQKRVSLKTSGNPLFSGWYADPEAIIYGKEYWIYPTYSDKYENQVFLDAFSSTDLISWKKSPHILDTSAIKWANKAMWAPSVLKKGKNYYFFFSANDVHPGEIGGIGVAVAKSPQGPYKDLIGRPLIDTNVNGAQPIDQFVFKDKDGQYYMFYGGWGHCNVVKLSADFQKLEPFSDGTLYKEITPENYVEGPFVFYRNNHYYFMWSEGGWTGPDYQVAYAMSDNLSGPYKRIGTVLSQDTAIASGAGHHSMVHNPKSDKWYIVYHRRPKGETAANHRETCIEEIYFDANDKILPVKITKVGVAADKLR